MPVQRLAEVKSKDNVADEPKDTNPPPVSPVPAVTVSDEFCRLVLDIEELGKLNAPVIDSPLLPTMVDETVNDEPILTLPEVDKVFKVELPDTFSPFKAPKPVIEAPTPTLPEVVRVVELIFVAFRPCNDENPLTDNPPNTPTDETLTDPPTPTFPEVTKVLNRELPVTLRPDENTPKLVTVKEDPTPTLPEVVRVPKAELPVTDNPPLAKVNPVVVSEDPTPTLPEVTKDPPTPIFPKLAVFNT